LIEYFTSFAGKNNGCLMPDHFPLNNGSCLVEFFIQLKPKGRKNQREKEEGG
jgi:hypothetical protein